MHGMMHANNAALMAVFHLWKMARLDQSSSHNRAKQHNCLIDPGRFPSKYTVLYHAIVHVR
jgi:hypothetical protein